MKKTALLLSLFVIFLIGLWNIAIPEGVILRHLETAPGREGIYLEMNGFKKGLFYNFTVDKILLKKKNQGADGSTLLIFDEVKGGLNITSLFKLRPQLVFDCKMNKGEIAGTVGLIDQDPLNVSGNGIGMSGLPILESFGIKGGGNLDWSLHLSQGIGEARFSVDQAKISMNSAALFSAPLSLIEEIRGVVEINDGNLEIQSLFLEGRGASARVKGNIIKGRVDLKMELMLDSTLDEDYFDPTITEMLAGYKVSPGYYIIPINAGLFTK